MYIKMDMMNLIRYGIAYVFITSGVMKLWSDAVTSHFLSLGIPSPHQMLYIVAFAEIICGVMLIFGKWIRYACIPLIIIIIGAILFAKIPLLHTGFLPFAFQVRLDIIMLILLFILYDKSR